ncbi:MAG: site-2 protease family protein [Clostridia bacterium]|nr:site-2 protease family protein [Clostridia bacterium]
MFDNVWLLDLVSLAISIVVLLISITFHEVAHGYVSYKLGDDTAKESGRLSLNPFDHINFSSFLLLIIIMAIGTFTNGANSGFVMSLMSVMICFTFAAPVPVSGNSLKNPLKDMAVIAISGPVANIIIALISMVAIKYITLWSMPLLSGASFPGEFFFYVYYFTIYFFSYMIQLNIGLAIFNLLPIPPLDGSKILYRFLPRNVLITFVKYEKHITLVLLLLLVFDVLDRPLNLIGNSVFSGLEFVVDLLPPRG